MNIRSRRAPTTRLSFSPAQRTARRLRFGPRRSSAMPRRALRSNRIQRSRPCLRLGGVRRLSASALARLRPTPSWCSRTLSRPPTSRPRSRRGARSEKHPEPVCRRFRRHRCSIRSSTQERSGQNYAIAPSGNSRSAWRPVRISTRSCAPRSRLDISTCSARPIRTVRGRRREERADDMKRCLDQGRPDAEELRELTMYLERFRLDGRVAVVTGGAQAIGFACVEALSEAGAHVYIADRNEASPMSMSSASASDDTLSALGPASQPVSTGCPSGYWVHQVGTVASGKQERQIGQVSPAQIGPPVRGEAKENFDNIAVPDIGSGCHPLARRRRKRDFGQKRGWHGKNRGVGLECGTVLTMRELCGPRRSPLPRRRDGAPLRSCGIRMKDTR